MAYSTVQYNRLQAELEYRFRRCYRGRLNCDYHALRYSYNGNL